MTRRFYFFVCCVILIASFLLLSGSMVADKATAVTREVTLVVTFETKPGSEKNFKQLMLPHIQRSRAEAGCLIFNLHQTEKNPTTFVLYEKWKDQEAFDRHLQKPYTLEVREVRQPLLAKPFQDGLVELIDLAPVGQPAK